MSEIDLPTKPDAHLDELVAKVQRITEDWAKRHDLWHDSVHKDPIAHYQSEPGEESPILLLCSDGPAMTAIVYDDDCVIELRDELERVGVFMEMDDRVTACYHLRDSDSQLQKDFDRQAAWKWTCKLIEGDAADVSGDLYQHFADHPDDFHKLPHREFERLVSSVFAARGWRTELGPGSNDGGVDLRIWQSDPIGDQLTLVQIKRYAPHRPVHLDAVAALEAHVNREGANRGLVVTSSRFLPGVHEFASLQQHRLRLAEKEDLQAWCAQAAKDQVSARNRVLALEELGPLMHELRNAVTHPRLLVGNRRSPSFAVVLRETRTSALLAHIPSRRVAGDEMRGAIVPVIDGTIVKDYWIGLEVMRAQRKDRDERVSYWGHRTLYWPWDGKPYEYDHWD